MFPLVPLLPAYPKADAMPVGLYAGLFVNGWKYNDLGLLLHCPTAQPESSIVHFL
jgi:hypothetical protein